MSTAKTSAAVMNISMKTACALDVPTEGTVLGGDIRGGRSGEERWETSLYLEWNRKKGLKQRRRHDGTQELGDHIQEEPDWVNCADKEHRKGYIGVEEATRDAVKEPHRDEEGESHRDGRVQDGRDGCAARDTVHIGRGHERGLDATKAEEKEQDLD